MESGSTAILDASSLTTYLTLDKFTDVIEAILPIVGVAVLVGFLCYFIKWGIRLFRGV